MEWDGDVPIGTLPQNTFIKNTFITVTDGDDACSLSILKRSSSDSNISILEERMSLQEIQSPLSSSVGQSSHSLDRMAPDVLASCSLPVSRRVTVNSRSSSSSESFCVPSFHSDTAGQGASSVERPTSSSTWASRRGHLYSAFMEGESDAPCDAAVDAPVLVGSPSSSSSSAVVLQQPRQDEDQMLQPEPSCISGVQAAVELHERLLQECDGSDHVSHVLRELDKEGILRPHFPVDERGVLTSFGSIPHMREVVGTHCKQCAFWPQGRCKKGMRCQHCHFIHLDDQIQMRPRPSQKTRRKLAKRKEATAQTSPDENTLVSL